MSWFSVSGFSQMLKGIVTNRDFQQSALDFLMQVGQKVVANKNNPAEIAKIGEALSQHPQAALGAIVKNTDAEQHVDANVIKAADTVK